MKEAGERAPVDRKLVWWCAGCDDCTSSDQRMPCNGPSHDGELVVRASDYDAQAERIRELEAERDTRHPDHPDAGAAQ